MVRYFCLDLIFMHLLLQKKKNNNSQWIFANAILLLTMKGWFPHYFEMFATLLLKSRASGTYSLMLQSHSIYSQISVPFTQKQGMNRAILRGSTQVTLELLSCECASHGLSKVWAFTVASMWLTSSSTSVHHLLPGNNRSPHSCGRARSLKEAHNELLT